jgi:hypothetical protein
MALLQSRKALRTALFKTADRLGASGLAHLPAVGSHKRNAMFELYTARQAESDTRYLL